MLLTVLAVPSSAQPVPSPTSATATKAAHFVRPTFEVRRSVDQLTILDATPGETLNLWRTPDRTWPPTFEKIRSVQVDEMGSAVLRELPNDALYTIQIGRSVKWFRHVLETEAPPRQWFYDRQELEEGFTYIKTRDGTTLSANVVLPGPPEDGPYPTVVEYSGYDPSNPYSDLGPAQPGSLIASLLGYAIVGVNVRGTGCSGGAYDFFETMQVLDGYDVIETVAAQDWVLGNRVGMVGLSYPGISQLFVAQTNPPSLAAITPLSVYADTATGILRPGGLLNVGFATSWADGVLSNSEPRGTGWVRQRIDDDGDQVCAENQRVRLQNVDATEKARANPFVTEEVAGPLDIRRWAGDIEAAVFHASGWQDEQTGPSFGDLIGEFDSAPSARHMVYNGLHGDGFAPPILAEWAAFLDLYVAQRKPVRADALLLVSAVLSNQLYGGTVAPPPDRWTGVATYEQALAQWESEPQVQVLFDSGAVQGPGLPVAGFTAEGTTWPLDGTTAQRWYFGGDGALLDAKGPYAETSFVPDPDVGLTDFFGGSSSIWQANPAYNWNNAVAGTEIAFETEPLTEDVVMTGSGSVDLVMKSSATNADLEVVLTEIRPDGNETYVQAGELQASYRALRSDSTELHPVFSGTEADNAPLVPDTWTYVRVPLGHFAHAFRAGSQIRIAINTPGGDQPRWAYETLGLGPETTHTVLLGTPYSSSVALPVNPTIEVPTPLPPCPSLRGQPCRPAQPISNP